MRRVVIHDAHKKTGEKAKKVPDAVMPEEKI